MLSASSSSRPGAIINLAGTVIIIIGLFLPMFMQSNPQLPGSIHPIYEWQAVRISTNTTLTVLFSLGVALPLLSMLIILTTSVATLFSPQRLPPGLVILRRIAAIVGLTLQILFESIIYLLSQIGYARTDISWGFILMPIGFLVLVISVFFVEPHFTPTHS